MMRSAEEQRGEVIRTTGRAGRVRRSGSRRCVKSQAGFTLIELTFAMGILLVGMLVSFASQITSGQIIDSSQDATIIVADLERCMEEVLLQSADDIPTVYPEGVVVPGYSGLHVREELIVPRYLNLSLIHI